MIVTGVDAAIKDDRYCVMLKYVSFEEPVSTSKVAFNSGSTIGFVANTCKIVTFRATLIASDAMARVRLLVTDVNSET